MKEELSFKQRDEVEYKMLMLNLGISNILYYIILCVETAIIIFVDIPNIKVASKLMEIRNRYYIFLHGGILLITLIGICVNKIIKEKRKKSNIKLFKFVIVICPIIILVLTSIITSIAQYGNSQISAYILTSCIVAIGLTISFPLSIIVYAIPYICFVVGLFICQNNKSLFASNLNNGSIEFIFIIFISKINYDRKYELMVDNMLLEEVNEKLEFLSTHDPLTGLENRRSFEEKMFQKLDGGQKSHKSSALVLVDIDHYKKVNDKYGHFIGDLVLKEIADILKNSIRETDVASRWGGEEFLLLITENSIEDAERLVNRIRKTIEDKEIKVDGVTVQVTASFGVAAIGIEPKNSFEVSYKLVDEALYKAKKEGRNKVIFA